MGIEEQAKLGIEKDVTKGLVQTFTRNGIEIEIQGYAGDEVTRDDDEDDEEDGGLPFTSDHHESRPQLFSIANSNGSSSKDNSTGDNSSLSKIDETLETTIITEIQQAQYICLVCTGEIDKNSKIWSCQECFRVYDLECIKDWAIRGSSTNKLNKTWRCPSCNYETKKLPAKFTCWCGKVKNPEINPLMPFSCGNLCNYKYSDCIHRCLNTCHPGKHPVCGATGPMMKCQCGKEKRQVPCIITPYKKGWKCEAECGKALCDLKHKCKKGCHSGSCGKCVKKVDYKCYCGDTKLRGKCSKRVPLECVGRNGKKWIGGGSCGKRKKYYYDCGQHYEVLECQPLGAKAQVSKCKFSPDIVSSCYCGKSRISTQGRSKCTDPIPECENVCGKLLPCGCYCKFKCHPGECECVSIFPITCSCGYEQFSAPCKYVQSNQQPKCHHKCSVLLSCRKHYHRKECCEYEQVALERERAKKKALRNNLIASGRDDIMSIEAVHICTQTCNRLKSCGVHECQAMCHAGPCEVCLESTNEDLICNCGKTVIPAPVRCGTELVCHEQCVRPKECGHRQEAHECHPDSIKCPKCTTIVKKPCDCGARNDLPGIMCSQERVSCGKMCSVFKECGHPCLRTCSPKCTKENDHISPRECQSICQKVRKSCPHTCKLKCHFVKVGKSPNCDVLKCNEIVTVSCSCGNLKRKVKCGASVNNPSSIYNILECDESCTAAKRDAQLRSAFAIGISNSDTIDNEAAYTDFVVETYYKQKKWCSKIEDVIRTFIGEYNLQIENGVELPKRTYHFPAMVSLQRQFVHELSQAFSLYTESQDSEPKRSVFVVITRLTKLPAITIKEYVEMIKEQEQNKARELTQEEIDMAFYNAIVIRDLFFGVNKEDLEKELLKKQEAMDGFVIQWIKDSTFVLYNQEKYKIGSTDVALENQLSIMSNQFGKILREKSLAFDCKLCFIDDGGSFILKTEKKKTTNVSSNVETKMSRDKNVFNVLQNDKLLIQS
ncbi:FAP1 [Candida oxycetoniae]|uniref:FAP1 n=1 Tax=Candida oxycetoniae TaxID=497107 RepID=A0AAI9SVF3_9ASCO|nr:FAP1 [Candida oxycetoniae]KAI3403808.2 FAP1 [Candida oxycetoniae]